MIEVVDIMKKIILMRHAEAQSDQSGLNDRDRPLSGAGMQELEFMRQKLQGNLEGLHLVLCSNVKRARQTLEGIKPILPSHCDIVFEDDLYHTSALGLVSRFQDLEDHQDFVMMIVHNPAASDFLNLVIASTQGQSRLPKMLSTAGVAIFEGNFENWQDVSSANFRLQALWDSH